MRAAVDGVVREAIIAACLTGLMILIFLGSWRSTLIIAVSIPLSILTSVIVLSFLHETINIMTLGGLALAVGILVDDATVTIENIERYLEEGHNLHDAILEGAAQISVPALVSTLYLYRLPAHVLSQRRRAISFRAARRSGRVRDARVLRTFPDAGPHAGHVPAARKAPWAGPLPQSLSVVSARVRARFRADARLISAPAHELRVPPVCFRPGVSGTVSLRVSPDALAWPGFFPDTDSGQFILHLRAKTGTRIEETARLCDIVENAIRQNIPSEELDNILDNIGLPYSTINTTYSRSGLIGAGDADIMVSLKPDHRPTADYVRLLRKQLPVSSPV